MNLYIIRLTSLHKLKQILTTSETSRNFFTKWCDTFGWALEFVPAVNYYFSTHYETHFCTSFCKPFLSVVFLYIFILTYLQIVKTRLGLQILYKHLSIHTRLVMDTFRFFIRPPQALLGRLNAIKVNKLQKTSNLSL